MEGFLFYIGKAAIAAGVFYLAFLVLFQNQKHFGFNRVYLPVSLLVSFLIPLLTFTTVQYIEPSTFDYNSFVYLENSAEKITQPRFEMEWYHYLFGMYLLGGAGFLLFLVTGHFKAFQIIRKSRIQQLFESWVNVTRKDVHPFSFFSKIVLSERTLPSENLQMIICHEKIHVREKHTLDILFVEILFLFQWFNPFAWLLKDAVKNNLEYKTDHQIAQKFNPQKYQMAMVALADKKGVAPFLTALNGSQLKNRIIMMKKKTENKFALVKQLLVLPLLAVLIMGLSAREVKTEFLPQQSTESNSTANLVIIVDGQEIPTNTGNLSQFDFSKEFDGGKIIEALGLDENEIEINGLSFNEDLNEFRYFVRTTSYVEGSNAEFDEMTKKQEPENQATKPAKTLYAIDGQIKTKEEIGNFDNYSFESLVILNGKSATDKYGDIAIGASVMDFKTGESKIKVSSENKIVKGKVFDAKRNPIPGVDMYNKFGEKLTTTDSDGNYEIKIANDEEPILFIKRNFQNKTVKLTGNKEINVELVEDTNQKKESVEVIGYGQNSNVNQQIRVRATGSSTGEGKPLFFVDGKEVENAEDIDPNSIESMTVLKDESATALYGEKAKNGVILITLKKQGSTANNKNEEVKVIGYGTNSNANQQIQVRANGSTSGSKPLFIVDGKDVENADHISPAEIENIEVFKGESAIALYGEKAKDGVIIITTKKAGTSTSNNKNEEVKVIGYGQQNDKNPEILIRSVGSTKNPLVMVDGKKYKSMEDANIKPENIDNITVLKDEAAKNVYGEKAKNGVIVIETKKITSDAKGELKNFLISIELKQNTVVLRGLNGCVFKELSFTIKDNNPVPVDKFGMASTEPGNSESEFLFNVEKVNDEIILTGKKGTAWQKLTFKPSATQHFINEFGVSSNQ